MNLTLQIPSGDYLKQIPITIQKDGRNLLIRSGYDKSLVEELKQLPEARWKKELKCWSVLDSERTWYSLKCLESNRQLFPCRAEWVDRAPKRNVFDHQRDGIQFILNNKRVLLAFEMGLGKTLTTLEAVEYIIETTDQINWWLVAPFGAQQEWKRQIKKWNSIVRFTVVSTYESLHTYMDSLPDSYIPNGVVFDESVKIKNHSTQRSQVASELSRLVRSRDGYIIELSGAPAPKNPIDWWHQVEILQPGFIREGNPYKFMARYANVEQVDHGYGPHNEIKSWKLDELEKLGKRLAPIVMVRSKKDCLDLPSKIYDEIQCPVSDELFRMADVAVSLATTGIGALEVMRQLSDGFRYKTGDPCIINDSTVHIPRELVQLESIPKLDVIKELLDQYHTDNGGPGRLVIYAVYHASIDMLVRFCQEAKWKCERIDGRGWSNENILEDFEDSTGSDERRNYCIVANPACVYGLTLSRTYALVYYSNSFNADHRIQSEDRRDRPGMDVTKGTRIVDLLCLPTDKYILDNVKEKRTIQGITLESIKCLMKSV